MAAAPQWAAVAVLLSMLRRTCVLASLARAEEASSAFLGSELPLKVLAVLPGPSTGTEDAASKRGTRLSGRDALTMVFSRSVIALGSDWSPDGGEGDLSSRPFSLTACAGQPAFKVPGKFRWATTSTARFDPDVDWPTDLCFDLAVSPVLRSFDGLGVAHEAGGAPVTRRFTTRPVRMSLSYVRSEQASNLTGSRWSSLVLDADDDGLSNNAHEVPPDGVVYLSFSAEVNHSVAFDTLRAANPKLFGTGHESLKFDDCGRRCLAVRPRGLALGGAREVVFPAGGAYGDLSGLAGERQAVKLSGLQPFRFPFWYETPPKEQWKIRNFRYRRYNMYLLHGLSRDSTAEAHLAELKKSITLKSGSGKVLEFSLSLVDPATLRLEAGDLEPGTKYKIHVAASTDVRDGFGLPLQSSSMSFATDGYPDRFMEPFETPSYFREFPHDWQVLVAGSNSYCEHGWGNDCKKAPAEIAAWPVTRETLKAEVIRRFNTKVADPASRERVVAQEDGSQALRNLSIDASKFLTGPNRTGLFLRASRSMRGRVEKSFVSVASFGISLVATAGNRLIVWATSFEDGRPVQGATVTVFRLVNRYRATEAETFVVGTAVTDASGIAIIAPQAEWSEPYSYPTYVAAAEAPDGGIAICEDPPVPWAAQERPPLAGALVTDRAVYRPGDTVHIKGYVRARSADGLSQKLPGVADGSFVVDVRWKGGARATPWGAPKSSGADAQARTEVRVSRKYGTISANMTVPEAAGAVGFGDIPIRLLRLHGDEEATVASATVVVADPRPPTVALELTTRAAFADLGAGAAADVELRTTTYSGAAVEGAEVELRWTLRRALPDLDADLASGGEVVGIRTLQTLAASSGAPMAPAMSKVWRPPVPSQDIDGNPEGTLRVTTGAGGRATASLRLAELLQTAGPDGAPAAPCQEGDHLEVTARWVGPTREVVTAKLSKGPLRIARSAYTLSIAPSSAVGASTGLPLPGTPLAVLVDVRDADGKTVPDVEVTVSLHEWNGSAVVSEGAPTKMLPPDTWGVLRGKPCVAHPDGAKEAQCASTVTLPDARRYVVLARATGADGAELVSGFAVGKTPEEWRRRPLATISDLLLVRLDKETYRVGDAARLTVTPPFRDAVALVVWGNEPGVKTLQQKLAGPPNAEHHIDVEVGDECRLGCKVLVVLAVPNQREEDLMPMRVPTSPLLDLTLPRTLTHSVQLKVPGPSHEFAEGDVKVAVLGVGGAPVEVLEPGAEAVVEVSLPPSEAGAEVCIFVTDRAMLDVGEPLHPHELVMLGPSFDVTRGEDFRTADTRARLASARGYEFFVNTSLRRAALDPWAVEERWSLLPDAHGKPGVEQTDEAFFADRASDLTRFPRGSHWVGMVGDEVLLGAADDMAANGMVRERMAPMAFAAQARAAPMAMMAKSMPESAAAAAPPVPDAGGGGGAAPLGRAVYARTKFEITPLFADAVVAGADGKATVALRLPDNIATFEVRAYVVDGRAEHRFGQASASVIARRAVSLVPSLPRVVRPGDRFECGVTVTRHKAGGAEAMPALDVTATVANSSHYAALRMAELRNFSATADGGAAAHVEVPSGGAEGPREVVFPFEAPPARRGGGAGAATLRFSASVAGNGVVDVLESPLRVRPPQAPVVVATSMALTASPAQAVVWPEGIDLPEAMPGSGAVELIAGVGHLPSVSAAAADVADQDRSNGEAWASALLPAAALRPYCGAGISGAALPTEEEIAMARAEGLFDEAVQRLPAYTDMARHPPLGLFWHPRELTISQYPASVSLNAFGLIVARLVEVLAPLASARADQVKVAAARPSVENHRTPQDGLPTFAVERRLPDRPRGDAAGGCGAVRPEARVPQDLQAAWRDSLEGALQRKVEEARRFAGKRCKAGECFQSWSALAEIRAALGPSWQHRQPDLQAEFSMDKLFGRLDEMSPRDLAHAALAYTLHADAGALDGEAGGRLDRIYGRLASMVRMQGRTAYIAAARGSQHSAGSEANSVVLLALARAGAPALDRHFASSSGSSFIARLATYVADGGGASAPFGGGRWASPRATALGGAALAAYDVAFGMTAPNMSMTARSGETKLLEYAAHGRPIPPASSSTPWDALPSPPKPVLFSVSQGHGQVSIVAALTFVPASSPTKGAVYRGLFVQKVVRKMGPSGQPTGPPLKIVQLGDSIVVTIQVTTPDDVSRVTLEDFTAGGLEPVDASVAGDDAGSSAGSGCGGRGFFWWWCWPSFFQLAVRPDRVSWSSQSVLPAGTHSVSYQAVAATRGVFALPPAQASVNDQPEVLGLSESGVIVVAGENPNAPLGGGAAQAVPDPADAGAVVAFLARHGVEASADPSAPMACPGGCPNGGVCQLSTGKCACYSGAKYIDGDCPQNATGLHTAIFTAAESGVGHHGFDDDESSPTAAWRMVTAVVATLALLVPSVLYIRKTCAPAASSDYEDAPYQYRAGPPLHECEMTSLVGNAPDGLSTSRSGPYL